MRATEWEVNEEGATSIGRNRLPPFPGPQAGFLPHTPATRCIHAHTSLTPILPPPSKAPPHYPRPLIPVKTLTPATPRPLHPKSLSWGFPGTPMVPVKALQLSQSLQAGSTHHSCPASPTPHPSDSIFFKRSRSVGPGASALWLRNNFSSPGPLVLTKGLGGTCVWKPGLSHCESLLQPRTK